MTEALIALFLGVICFYVNRHIRLNALYMDDLYLWSYFGEQNFWEFSFPVGGATRFRPVYWMLSYLDLVLAHGSPSRLLWFNLCSNAGIAYLIYRIGRKMSGNCRMPGLLAGCLYLISHLSYYQIAQLVGVLESYSLLFALLLFSLLFADLHRQKPRYLQIQLLYFLLVFTHERYLALFPVFYFWSAAWWMLQRRKGQGRTVRRELRKALGSPLLTLALILWVRLLFIGSIMPVGTGGTRVTETFTVGTALRFCVQQLLYLFSVNAGPDYLSGISWAETARSVKVLVILSWIPLLLLLLWNLKVLLRGKEMRLRYVTEHLFFLLYMALCIGGSSVTIRLEMRWVYVSYAIALLYLCRMIGQIREGKKISGETGMAEEGAGRATSSENPPEKREKAELRRLSLMLTGLFFCYAALTAPIEHYYRSHYRNLYFWENQDRMNSLYGETIEKYGRDAVLGKQVYILENNYGMSAFYGRTFFRVYDPERSGRGTEIHFVSSLSALPDSAGRDNALVLREVPERRGYQDITAEAFPEG